MPDDQGNTPEAEEELDAESKAAFWLIVETLTPLYGQKNATRAALAGLVDRAMNPNCTQETMTQAILDAAANMPEIIH